MDQNLVDPDLSPGGTQTNANSDLMEMHPPLWLLGLPPVMKAKHDGEGAGGKHLLVVIVVEAVGRCEGKSVPNLKQEVKIYGTK